MKRIYFAIKIYFGQHSKNISVEDCNNNVRPSLLGAIFKKILKNVIVTFSCTVLKIFKSVIVLLSYFLFHCGPIIILQIIDVNSMFTYIISYTTLSITIMQIIICKIWPVSGSSNDPDGGEIVQAESNINTPPSKHTVYYTCHIPKLCRMYRHSPLISRTPTHLILSLSTKQNINIHI